MIVLQMRICLKIFLFALQCVGDATLAGDETIHILSHYTNCPVDKLCWCLKRWMEMGPHENFVQNIASDLLHQKGLTVEEYCENIMKPQWPLDEIALVLFGWLYKFHICVFLEVKYWSTGMSP